MTTTIFADVLAQALMAANRQGADLAEALASLGADDLLKAMQGQPYAKAMRLPAWAVAGDPDLNQMLGCTHFATMPDGRAQYSGIETGSRGGIYLYDVRPSPLRVTRRALAEGAQIDLLALTTNTRGWHNDLIGQYLISERGALLMDVSTYTRYAATVNLPGKGLHLIQTDGQIVQAHETRRLAILVPVAWVQAVCPEAVIPPRWVYYGQCP